MRETVIKWEDPVSTERKPLKTKDVVVLVYAQEGKEGPDVRGVLNFPNGASGDALIYGFQVSGGEETAGSGDPLGCRLHHAVINEEPETDSDVVTAVYGNYLVDIPPNTPAGAFRVAFDPRSGGARLQRVSYFSRDALPAKAAEVDGGINVMTADQDGLERTFFMPHGLVPQYVDSARKAVLTAFESRLPEGQECMEEI